MECNISKELDKKYLSVIIPVYNEAENVSALAHEITASLKMQQYEYEIIFVDDASEDNTLTVLQQLEEEIRPLRLIAHRMNYGQSAAVATGFRSARGTWVATLDGDSQNDPADIPKMLEYAEDSGMDCVCGVRSNRRDTYCKKIASRIGNIFRNLITGDEVSDSGCGIRVVRSETLAEIPIFNGMHRFLPTLLRAGRVSVAEIPVNHRPRMHGETKYGVHNRLWRGIRDCLGVRWYIKRAFPINRLDSEFDGKGSAGRSKSPDSAEIKEKNEETHENSSALQYTPPVSWRMLILVFAGFLVLLLHHFGFLQNPLIDMRNIIDEMGGKRVKAGIVFFFLTCVMVSAGVPRLFFFAFGGVLFDFWPGMLLALSGSLTGSLLAFYLIRWAARDWFVKRFSDNTFFKNITSTPSNTLSVFFVRQIPLSCMLINAGLAISSVQTGSFLLGSLIGFLPQGIIFSLIGSGLGDTDILEGAGELTAAALFSVTIAFFFWRIRVKARHQKKNCATQK